MLVTTNKRLVPSQVNTIILQGEDGMYYYLHRDLYDQLTVLYDNYSFGENTHILCNLIGYPMDTWPDNVRHFYETAPGPIKMAAPYLMLVTRVEELSTMEDMCGALTVISMSINLRRFPKVDKSIRASITFSLYIREEYRMHWDRFFQENLEFEQLQSGAAVPAPRAYTHVPTPTGHIAVNEETKEESNVTYVGGDFDLESLLGGILEEAIEHNADVEDDMSDDEDDEPAPTRKKAAKQEKVKSGFDLLDGV